MRNLLMAGAALMLGTVPMAVSAQDAASGVNSVDDKRGYDALEDLDEIQRAEYDAWTGEYQTAYMAWPSEYRTAYWGWPDTYRSSYWTWPADYQTYYWTLTPAQQEAYWVLTNDQRAKMAAMTDAQRVAAWNSIQAQMAGTTTTTTPPVATSGTVTRFVTNETAQVTPAPQTGEYPVCKGDIQDSCIQPRAAGLNWGNRPLDHWPGKPASEM